MVKQDFLRKGEIIQSIIFDKDDFEIERKVKDWIIRNDFIFANKKKPIQKWDNHYRVRQIDPELMIKSSYREFIKGNILYVIGILKLLVQKKEKAEGESEKELINIRNCIIVSL